MGDNMCIKAFAKYLRSALRRFGTNERGNVVFMFALVTVPMIGVVGAAVDYSNANSVKSAMQTAADFDRTDAIEGRVQPEHNAVEH